MSFTEPELESRCSDRPSPSIKATFTIRNNLLNGPDVTVTSNGDLVATVQSNRKTEVQATIGQMFEVAFQGQTQIVKVKKTNELLVIDANSLRACNRDLASINDGIRLYPLAHNRNLKDLKSPKGEIVAYITFMNITAYKTSIMWINHEGYHQPYKTLGGYENYRVQTYVTHPWVVIVGGRCVVFIPTAGVEYTAVIGAMDGLPALVPLGTCGGLRSTTNGPDTSINFINDGAKDADIYWINFEGALVLYKTLKPGDIHHQHTYINQPWRVDVTNGPKTCYMPVDSDSYVYIAKEPEC